MIQTFETLSGIYNVSPNVFFQEDTGDIRGHSAKLFNKRSRLDIRNTFSHMVIFVMFSLRATMLLHLNLNTVVDTSVFSQVFYFSFSFCLVE